MAIISPLPYTIANGQAVDAAPVMADLNQIVNNVNANAAGLSQSNTYTSGTTQNFTSATTLVSGTTSGTAEPVPRSQADTLYAPATAVATTTFHTTSGAAWSVSANSSVLLGTISFTTPASARTAKFIIRVRGVANWSSGSANNVVYIAVTDGTNSVQSASVQVTSGLYGGVNFTADMPFLYNVSTGLSFSFTGYAGGGGSITGNNWSFFITVQEA